MRKRGRISSAELTSVVIDAGRCIPSSPPSELTDAQATVWRDVVGSLPDNWLTRAAHPILIAFCGTPAARGWLKCRSHGLRSNGLVWMAAWNGSTGYWRWPNARRGR